MGGRYHVRLREGQSCMEHDLHSRKCVVDVYKPVV